MQILKIYFFYILHLYQYYYYYLFLTHKFVILVLFEYLFVIPLKKRLFPSYLAKTAVKIINVTNHSVTFMIFTAILAK